MNRQMKRITPNPTSTLSLVGCKIKDLVSKGLFQQTIQLYKEEIHLFDQADNDIILPSVIKACSAAPYIHFGVQLHCATIKTGSILDTCIANSLISMYSKCSGTEPARLLFDSMPIRDTITWNSIVNCYIQNGYALEAFESFTQMCLHGFQSKPELTASVLSICGRTGKLSLGKEIHGRVIVNGEISWCIYLTTSLLDMYSRCFELEAAYDVFQSMEERNEVSWTAMIAGCTTNEHFNMSLDLFRAMLVEGFKPNRVTLIAVLPACAELGSLIYGKQIHGYAIRRRFELEPQLAAALIDMYTKCGGSSAAAEKVFERSEGRDVVMWSSMIASYAKSGDIATAIKHLNQMRAEGIKPNMVTMLAVITPSMGNHGQAVHGYIVKTGFLSDIYVGNTLVDMYAKCGYINASHQVFEEIPTKDSVSWTVLIQGYALSGRSAEALQLFTEMQQKGIEPDGITFLAVLSACSHGGLIEEGGKIFKHMQKDNKIDITVEHYACYIDLLGRSGKIEDACKVITDMPIKASPAIWSSLVSACKVHGKLGVAKNLVYQLIDYDPENPGNYTLSRMVYSEINDWHAAEEVHKVMKEKGLKKNIGYSHLDFCFP